jgi:hypothetical protein
MDCTVRAMTCRFGACCSSALNCPWWHSAEEIKIFKDEVELQKRKLAVRCGFCARGECRFGADCKRAKRVEEIEEMRTKSVAPTDLGSDMCAGADGEARDAAAAVRVGGGNGRTAGRKTAGKGVERDVEAVDRRPFVFGRKKVGVARRPSAMVDAGGVGGAGAFGALASAEEKEVVEEEVDITFLLPKPKEKVKEQRREKAAVRAAVDAAEKAAEGGSGAAEAAAETAVVRADKLRDLEVLTIGSDPIVKISEETGDKEKAAGAARGARKCSLVAAMVTAGAAKAAAVKETAVAAEKAAATSAEKAAATEDRAECQQKTKTLLEMRAVQQDRKKISEKAEDKVERLRKCLEQSMW